MLFFYVLSFFKNGDTIQGGTLFKEIRYFSKMPFKNDVGMFWGIFYPTHPPTHSLCTVTKLTFSIFEPTH